MDPLMETQLLEAERRASSYPYRAKLAQYFIILLLSPFSFPVRSTADERARVQIPAV